MSEILVTGASGFIGTHLVPALFEAGHEVQEANRDSGDVADEISWQRSRDAEVVIHLAAQAFVPDSWARPGAFIECNLMGTVRALDYCREHDSRLIFLSSYLYGTPETLPIPETAALVTPNAYALSKKLGEEVCQFYSDKFGVQVTVFRPFNVYGPGQRDEFLIPSIIRQIVAGGAIEVKDLQPKRDYIFVSDVVHAILKAVHCDHRFGIFNLGSGVSHSVCELINVAQSLANTDLPVRSTAKRRRDEIMDSVADVSRAREELGWEPQVTLREGLQRMLAECSSG